MLPQARDPFAPWGKAETRNVLASPQEENVFHPVSGCLKRLKEHQAQIDTDFHELRTRFAKGYPAVGGIPAVSPPTLNAILASVIESAPARLRELKQQLADCLHWELCRHGQHICSGIEVSESTIRALYAEVNQEFVSV